MNSNEAPARFANLGPSEMLREILRMHDAAKPRLPRGDEPLTPDGEALDEMRRRLVLA